MTFCALIEPKKKAKGQIVSVIGGGGKSSLLQILGEELKARNFRVILTSTTKIEHFAHTGLVLLQDNKNALSELRHILNERRVALVAQKPYKGNKLLGITPRVLSKLKDLADAILVEADGSRQRPLKTHKANEPVVPAKASTVIIIVGAEVVNQRLSDQTVHRAELFSKKWAVTIGATLTPETIARELLSPQGYLRNIPLDSRVVILINKSDLNLEGGTSLAKLLAKDGRYPVFLGSLKENSILQIFSNNAMTKLSADHAFN